MSQSKNIFVFTDIDLDGAMSYLLLLWGNNNKYIPYICTRSVDFRSVFSAWLGTVDIDTYDTVYILDLDVSQDCLDLIDRENVVVIDHHTSHVNNLYKYRKAKTLVVDTTSTASLLYKILNKKHSFKLTREQKILTLLVDDYDSYLLQLSGSHELNLIYWNYQGNKARKFVKAFKDGFTGFTDDEKKIITFYKNKINKVNSNLDIFESVIKINSKEYKMVSTFASTCINDVADYIIKTTSADVGIVINLESNKVSFRKKRESDLDLSKMAYKLTNGGGHSYAAGGLVTDKFLQFSKLFSPIIL